MITIVGRRSSHIELEADETVSSIMIRLGLSDNSYVCLINGKPVTSDHMAHPGDSVTFLEVFSGG
ncbi:MAG: MoaD/ThiS family protein [Thermoplasmataceae archaeon]